MLTTQNDFVYGELRRLKYVAKRYFNIIKYCFQILTTPENKNIKLIYYLMVNDLEELPNNPNWASLVRQLLMSLGFYEVWLAQGVGNIDSFLSVFKQRLNDTFMQNWRERIDDSLRAIFFFTRL